MAQQWQIRRGTNSENNDFTGAAGEVTMDTDRKELRLHDGSTQGGTIIGRNYKSNCITEIPQDIKLELNAGTLILKAGSKVYVPNGVGVFDKVVVPTDLSYSYAGSTVGPTDGLMFYDSTANVIFLEARTQTDSGTSRTSVNTFYNTNTNIIDSTNALVPSQSDKISFPVCSVKYGTSVSGTGHISLPETFNGFGYIGKTLFALPGVKGLIPNGRNTDGTLKNTEFSISSVLTRTFTTHNVSYGMLGINPSFSSYFGLSSNVSYDEQNNRVLESGVEWNFCIIGCASTSSGAVSYFNIKSPFRAVDYSEADFIVSFQRPTAANNYTWYRKYRSGWVEQGGSFSQTIGTTDTAWSATLPVPMANNNYTASVITNGGYAAHNTINCEGNTTTIIKGYAISSTSTSKNIVWQVSGMAA